MFLSYRGRYFDDALALSRRAASEGVPGAGLRSIRVVTPSEFAMEGELLSAGRRWMVINFFRHLIFNTPEFWIYRTEDFLESWWTLAEVVYAGVAISKAAEDLGVAPRLRVYQPETGQTTDDVGPFRVRMGSNERTHHRAVGESCRAGRELAARVRSRPGPAPDHDAARRRRSEGLGVFLGHPPDRQADDRR